MTPTELNARLVSLAAGGLKGRHVYAIAGPLQSGALPGGLVVRTVDALAWLCEREWPRGAAERQHAVAAAFADEVADVAVAVARPLLIRVLHADPLIGELGSLTGVYDRFLGDDRLLLFECARAVPTDVLSACPEQLAFRPNAALHWLAVEFNLKTVEA